jgi:hypothetical protein
LIPGEGAGGNLARLIRLNESEEFAFVLEDYDGLIVVNVLAEERAKLRWGWKWFGLLGESSDDQ